MFCGDKIGSPVRAHIIDRATGAGVFPIKSVDPRRPDLLTVLVDRGAHTRLRSGTYDIDVTVTFGSLVADFQCAGRETKSTKSPVHRGKLQLNPVSLSIRYLQSQIQRRPRYNRSP